MRVPLLDLKEQIAALRAELDAAYARVMDSGQFVLGPELAALESACAAATGTRHAIAVSSGTDAILLALMTLGIGPGDEVICPSFTFFATAGSIARVGAKPVFADSCAACFNLDAADAARKITPRTRAILPVHLFGQAAEMDAVTALAAEHGLAVIEDAAQAFSAGYKGRRVGSIGTFGAFSFFPSKNLGGFGDGGLLVTNDDRLGEKARLLRTHGARQKYFHEVVGGNFRMDALQAALLRVKLAHLDRYSERRAAHAEYYRGKLAEIPGVAVTREEECTCLGGRAASPPTGRMQVPFARRDRRHIWNQYTIRALERNALRSHLASREIGSEIYYPRPLHRQECFARPGEPAKPLPVCEQLAEEVLSLPVYPELRREQQDYVVAAIAEFLTR